ncbi:MAG: glycosyltransferase family 39 protein [Phycisphaerales bacterium]|nr:glycosyltransferase family 39 protein [Phycisphaerales bacterium]
MLKSETPQRKRPISAHGRGPVQQGEPTTNSVGRDEMAQKNLDLPDPSRAPTRSPTLQTISPDSVAIADCERLPSKGLHWVRYACGLGSLGLTLTVLILILARLPRECDNEWVESSMAHSALRILNGNPLYGPPTIEYVGDNYPPVYFYLCAGLMTLCGPSVMACRLASVISTFAIAIGIWMLGKSRSNHPSPRETQWARLVCVGLFFAFYAAGGQVYDLARVDMTAIAFAVWSVVIFIRFEGRWTPIVAGVLMGLAILTKHNMVMVGVALGVGLLIFRWRQAVVYGLFSAGLPLIVFALLEATTNGWSSFYLLTQPSLHPFGGGGRWIRFVAEDLNHHGLVMVIGMIAGGTILLKKWPREADWHRTVLLLLTAVGGLLVTLIARLKAGGFSNNLCPMWIFGLMAMAWMLPRLSSNDGRFHTGTVRRPSRLQWICWTMVLVQLVSLSRSFAELPWQSWLAAGEKRQAVTELDAIVSHHEADGPVWIPSHSFEAFAHQCPAGFLMDAPGFQAKTLFESDLVAHLRNKTWSAVILNGSRDRFVSELSWQSLIENYEEIELPIKNPQENTTLTGKRTFPQRLFVRRAS